jgi:hypothetical protein
LFVTHIHEVFNIIVRAAERCEAKEFAEEGEMKGDNGDRQVLLVVAIGIEKYAVHRVGREDCKEVKDESAREVVSETKTLGLAHGKWLF